MSYLGRAGFMGGQYGQHHPANHYSNRADLDWWRLVRSGTLVLNTICPVGMRPSILFDPAELLSFVIGKFPSFS